MSDYQQLRDALWRVQAFLQWIIDECQPEGLLWSETIRAHSDVVKALREDQWSQDHRT